MKTLMKNAMGLKLRWRHRRTTRRLESQDLAPVKQSFQLPNRRYVADAVYLLPKDEQEGHRLYLQHYALLQAIGNHYVAALDPAVRTMLDVGCGTGIWAVEMARAFPQSLVVGLDLDPALFRETPSFPTNCVLRVGDVLKGLPFPERFFSYCAGNWSGKQK